MSTGILLISLVFFVCFFTGLWVLQDIKIELRYRNILLENQNKILKNKEDNE